MKSLLTTYPVMSGSQTVHNDFIHRIPQLLLSSQASDVICQLQANLLN